jgi:DNA recombination protein RmuC
MCVLSLIDPATAEPKAKALLEGVQKKLQEAANKVEDVGKRSRAIERKLRDVQQLPASEAQGVLMLEGMDGDGEGEEFVSSD